MGLPNLSEPQISWITGEVAAYIEQQRQEYLPAAVPLSTSQRTPMELFFPESVLDAVHLIALQGNRVQNPSFYPHLLTMGFDAKILPDFAEMAAITFQDVIVSHEPFTDRLLFHELVHAVQYQKLGLPEFAAKYVTGFLRGGGYLGIPLEVNAYQLDARFATDPGKHFSVESEVQLWIDGGRF